MNNAGRWFEGTMGVISGMAPRPSTPQPSSSSNHYHPPARPASAPNSPRPYNNNNNNSMTISRLPSQDSLDRSIHNESGHGKSTAQIIKSLKHNNASLMAKQASMEADFMNQLNELTKTFADHKRKWELELKQQQISFQQEQAKWMQKQKEEQAFHKHEMSELKNQLFAKEEQVRLLTQSTPNIESTPEQTNENDLKQHISELEQELEKYATRVKELTLQASKIQKESSDQERYRKEEVEDLRVLQDAQEREMNRLRKELEEALKAIEWRDQELEDLKQELETLKTTVDTKTQELQQLSSTTATPDDRAELKAATEQLQQELKRANRELDTKTRELEDLQKSQQQEEKKDDSNMDLMQVQLEESRGTIARLERKLLETEGKYQQRIARMENEKSKKAADAYNDYQQQITSLEEEKLDLVQQLQEREMFSKQSDQEIEQLKETIRGLEQKIALAAKTKKKLREAQIALVALDDDKKKLTTKHADKVNALQLKWDKQERSFKEQLHAKDTELQRMRVEQMEIRQVKSEAQMDVGPNNRIKELEAAVEDRETTIAALLRSSVTLEQQVTSMKTELGTLRASKAKNFGDATGADVAELRSIIGEHKELEQKLKEEIASLKHELQTLKEGGDLNDMEELQNDFHEKLNERDAAIANLVKQSMSQEEELRKLRSKMQSMGSPRGRRGPSVEDLRERLRQMQAENEIFAGQIIEQDEEMEGLKRNLKERDGQVATYSKEIASLRAKVHSLETEANKLRKQVDKLENVDYDALSMPVLPSNDEKLVVSLRAEVDELRDANEDHRTELRDLRRQLREAKASEGEMEDLKIELAQAKRDLQSASLPRDDPMTKETIAKLVRELREVKEAKAEMEKSLSEHISSLERKCIDLDDSERQLRKRSELVEELRRSVDSSEDRMSALTVEVEHLRQDLIEKTEALEEALLNSHSYENNANELSSEKKELQIQVDKLTSELEMYADAKTHIDVLKGNIEEMTRTLQTTEDSYERKLRELAVKKDEVIDGLRTELAAEKTGCSEEVEEMKRHVQLVEDKKKEVCAKYEEQIQFLNNKLYALEQSHYAQSQLIENMKSEMDQLQCGMQQTTLSRRNETEEMQQEVMELERRAQQQEREITTLKMQLEESKLEYQAEVAKHRDTIASFEQHKPQPSPVDQLLDTRVGEVKERLEQLRWRNASLQEENKTLRVRLEKAEAERNITQNERYRTADLSTKVEKLNKRVRELESELETAKSQASTKVTATPTRSMIVERTEKRPEKRSKHTQPPPPPPSPGRAMQKSPTKTSQKFGLFRKRSQAKDAAEIARVVSKDESSS